MDGSHHCGDSWLKFYMYFHRDKDYAYFFGIPILNASSKSIRIDPLTSCLLLSAKNTIPDSRDRKRNVNKQKQTLCSLTAKPWLDSCKFHSPKVSINYHIYQVTLRRVVPGESFPWSGQALLLQGERPPASGAQTLPPPTPSPPNLTLILATLLRLGARCWPRFHARMATTSALQL